MGEGSYRGAMDGYAVGRVDDNEKEGLRGLRLAAAVRNGELWLVATECAGALRSWSLAGDADQLIADRQNLDGSAAEAVVAAVAACVGGGGGAHKCTATLDAGGALRLSLTKKAGGRRVKIVTPLLAPVRDADRAALAAGVADASADCVRGLRDTRAELEERVRRLEQENGELRKSAEGHAQAVAEVEADHVEYLEGLLRDKNTRIDGLLEVGRRRGTDDSDDSDADSERTDDDAAVDAPTAAAPAASLSRDSKSSLLDGAAVVTAAALATQLSQQHDYFDVDVDCSPRADEDPRPAVESERKPEPEPEPEPEREPKRERPAEDAAPPAAARKKPKKSAKTMFAGSDDSDSDEFE